MRPCARSKAGEIVSSHLHKHVHICHSTCFVHSSKLAHLHAWAPECEKHLLAPESQSFAKTPCCFAERACAKGGGVPQWRSRLWKGASNGKINFSGHLSVSAYQGSFAAAYLIVACGH
eukprot:1158683-Pelagomonas_calceolata.AAC.2